MLNLVIEPIFVLAALIAGSFFIGMPLAYYFTRPLAAQSKNNIFVFVYVAILLGYGQLLLISFYAMQYQLRGANAVALPVFLASAIIALFFAIWAKERFFPLLKSNAGPLAFFFVLLLLATAHVLLPVVIGKWEMAYATGDDAARWYMVVNYYQTHPFEFGKPTEETLSWSSAQRPLHVISGAVIASLFHIKASFAYSISSASALVMAMTGFSLVYEGMFGVSNQRSRYILWIVAALFFAVFGSFINVFYTGRLTHHFSMYPVIAALGFIAIRDEGLRRLGWYCLWGVLLAHFYSIRFSVHFFAIGMAMIFFQMIGREINVQAFAKNSFAFAASLIVAGLSVYQEIHLMLKQLQKGTKYLTMQLGSTYGADGSVLDRFFKWSGFLGTFESHESLKAFIQLGLTILIVLVFSFALIQAIKGFRRSSAYAGILVFNMGAAFVLFMTQKYYIALKLALYWPSYVLLGTLAFAMTLREDSRPKFRTTGNIFLVIAVIYIAVSARQFFPYFHLVDERYTKVDHVTNEMRQVVARHLESCPDCDRRIFGFDLSGERHLLLREIFRDYKWQPLRGKSLNFEHDTVDKNPARFNQYRYDILLFARTDICDSFDFSGNNDALIYERFPFKIFSSNASLLEYGSGIEYGIYEEYDTVKRCYKYGGKVTDDRGEIVFANNGEHHWLEIVIRVFRKNGFPDDAGKPFSITANDSAGKPVIRVLKHAGEFVDFAVKISDLGRVRLLKLLITKNDPEARVIMTLSKWGRGKTIDR